MGRRIISDVVLSNNVVIWRREYFGLFNQTTFHISRSRQRQIGMNDLPS